MRSPSFQRRRCTRVVQRATRSAPRRRLVPAGRTHRTANPSIHRCLECRRGRPRSRDPRDRDELVRLVRRSRRVCDRADTRGLREPDLLSILRQPDASRQRRTIFQRDQGMLDDPHSPGESRDNHKDTPIAKHDEPVSRHKSTFAWRTHATPLLIRRKIKASRL